MGPIKNFRVIGGIFRNPKDKRFVGKVLNGWLMIFIAKCHC